MWNRDHKVSSHLPLQTCFNLFYQENMLQEKSVKEKGNIWKDWTVKKAKVKVHA